MAEIRPTRHQTKSGKTYFIRSAHGKDAAKVLATAREIIGERVYSVTTPEEYFIQLEEEIGFLESYRKDPNRLFIVAETEEREIVGTLDFAPGFLMRHRHWGEFGMGVLASFRGEGIGRALLETLLNWTKERPNLKKVCLSVHAGNIPAIELYKKLGFEIEGVKRLDTCFGPGQYEDAVLMAKFLDEIKSSDLSIG